MVADDQARLTNLSQKAMSSRGQYLRICSFDTHLIACGNLTWQYRTPLTNRSDSTSIVSDTSLNASESSIARSPSAPSAPSSTSSTSSAALLILTADTESIKEQSSSGLSPLSSREMVSGCFRLGGRPLGLLEGLLFSDFSSLDLHCLLSVRALRMGWVFCSSPAFSACLSYCRIISCTYSRCFTGSQVASATGQPSHLTRYSVLPGLQEPYPSRSSASPGCSPLRSPPPSDDQYQLYRVKAQSFQGEWENTRTECKGRQFPSQLLDLLEIRECFLIYFGLIMRKISIFQCNVCRSPYQASIREVN